jgi:hypothetical protein
VVLERGFFNKLLELDLSGFALSGKWKEVINQRAFGDGLLPVPRASGGVRVGLWWNPLSESA